MIKDIRDRRKITNRVSESAIRPAVPYIKILDRSGYIGDLYRYIKGFLEVDVIRERALRQLLSKIVNLSEMLLYTSYITIKDLDRDELIEEIYRHSIVFISRYHGDKIEDIPISGMDHYIMGFVDNDEHVLPDVYPQGYFITGYEYYDYFLDESRDVIVLDCIGDKRIFDYHRRYQV